MGPKATAFKRTTHFSSTHPPCTLAPRKPQSLAPALGNHSARPPQQLKTTTVPCSPSNLELLCAAVGPPGRLKTVSLQAFPPSQAVTGLWHPLPPHAATVRSSPPLLPSSLVLLPAHASRASGRRAAEALCEGSESERPAAGVRTYRCTGRRALSVALRFSFPLLSGVFWPRVLFCTERESYPSVFPNVCCFVSSPPSIHGRPRVNVT